MPSPPFRTQANFLTHGLTSLPAEDLATLRNETTDCAICLDPFYADPHANSDTPTCQSPVRTSCGHIFGRACITRWIQEGHNTCPFDRGVLFGEPRLPFTPRRGPPRAPQPFERNAFLASVHVAPSASSRTRSMAAQAMDRAVARSRALREGSPRDTDDGCLDEMFGGGDGRGVAGRRRRCSRGHRR